MKTNTMCENYNIHKIQGWIECITLHSTANFHYSLYGGLLAARPLQVNYTIL